MATIHELNLRLIASRRHLKFKDNAMNVSWRFGIADSLNRYVSNWEDFYMPAKKKKGVQKPDWASDFAAVKLDAANKKAFEGWVLEQRKHEVEAMFELGMNGWKQSFSYDPENDCWIAAATMNDDDDINSKICCVSRSSDPFEAQWMNLYKIAVMYKGERLPTERPEDNWG